MESNKPPLTTSDGKTPLVSKPQQQQPKSDIFSTLAKWVVVIISIIPRFLASIMEHFTEAGSVGAVALGSLVFVVGVLFTADSYWQSLFQGAALFPFFEQTWAGWSWLPGIALFPPSFRAGIIFNPAFVFAIALSFVIQIIQSATVRNAAFKAKTVAGISPRTIGLIAIASWTFDLIQTFSSRNPLQYSDPGDIFKCLMYNLFSIVAAELGYVVYRMLKG
ncbi:hypothetical protein [Iningainema tapete]|uniref:Uncharacterized protein n=1 Tax=Iningainema tapete BLCC-T55 TaxID=2748662 RepID=A0A8J6XLX1_9CYAN|nr:hypothetical protein [Iningainema tapete]MBD2773331.1 hypothetical protein [Iningainema tapete BLCC-T55]